MTRIDKWLQVARVFKTRSQATRACSLGRVRVDGQRVKPHRILKVGDRVEIELRAGRAADWTRILVVKELHDRPLPKKEVPRIYADESPPRPRPDPLEQAMRRPAVEREAGLGRPTKKDRRRLERLRRGD
ncbi:MAG: S4 domain-containing protein [Thermoanaerobaculia bacterium]|nr:S4 domain-containing protein [Thermoanaerobaculia bacterium]